MKRFVTTLLITLLMPVALLAAAKPNIVFIFADDWGWGDLGCHGHPYVKTPNIDRLAKEGTDFHRFTVASGVCSPSRTAVMTGHFPARYKIDGHFAWVHSNEKRGMPDWLSPKAPLLPRFLQQAGYATAHYGKWHLANNMIPDAPLVSAYGYDDYGAFNCSGPQMMVHDDVKSAVGFIEKAHADNKPFFINLWMHEPHTPFHVDDKIQSLFPDLAEADNIYASVLYHADQRIGQLLDTLDRLKIADNTLVIFSSDNGPARGAPNAPVTLYYDSATGPGYGIGASKGITGGRRAFKGSLFEGGIGVPFIVRWPGKVASGKVDNVAMISAVDLLPTFCELAGAKLPSAYAPDGVSQVDALLGKSESRRSKPLFWKMMNRWPAWKSIPDHWPGYAVVHQNWKLLSSSDGKHLELYDLVKDPLEKNDVKDRHPEAVAQLTKLLDDWRRTLPEKADATCFSSYRKKPPLNR